MPWSLWTLSDPVLNPRSGSLWVFEGPSGPERRKIAGVLAFVCLATTIYATTTTITTNTTSTNSTTTNTGAAA